jgi:hypothetical protein
LGCCGKRVGMRVGLLRREEENENEEEKEREEGK